MHGQGSGKGKISSLSSGTPGVIVHQLQTAVLESVPVSATAPIAGETARAATGTWGLSVEQLGGLLAVETRKHRAQHMQQSLPDEVGKYSSS